MFRARLSAAVVVLGALMALALVVTVPRASAVEPFPILPTTMLTDHFAIHYDTDPDTSTDPSYITQQQATDIAGWAERAYTLYTSWGYPAPPTVAGRIDLYVASFDINGPPWTLFDAAAEPCAPMVVFGTCGGVNPPAGTGANVVGTILLDNHRGLNVHQVAHIVFNIFELGMWNESQPDVENNYYWLEQSAAEWAAYRVENFLTPTQASLGTTDSTGDCVGGECGNNNSTDAAGDPGWSFMEYLNERYGSDVVKSFFTDAVAVNDITQPATKYVSDVLTAKGGTFESVFTDYTVARLTGNFSILTIKGLLPAPTVSPILGSVTGAIPTSHIAVSHFAARYIALKHGDLSGNSSGTCYAASLALNVAIPPGINAKPYYYANTAGATAQALTVSGSTASITVPWNTCSGSPDAYLSLPNPSTDPAANGKEFTITGTLTVDLNTPTAATLPPAALYTGPTVAAPTADAVPTVVVYGAQIVRVSTVDRMVRLIVFSSGDGQLQASAGSTNLGTYQLRAGNNDVRFKLPQSIVNALRKPAGQTANASQLTLKFLSPGGTAGVTVSRKLALVKPVPAKKKK